MVPAIPEVLFITIESVVQTNQFNTDPADYAEVAQGIINEILSCKNMLHKIESMQIQLNVTQWAAS